MVENRENKMLYVAMITFNVYSSTGLHIMHFALIKPIIIQVYSLIQLGCLMLSKKLSNAIPLPTSIQVSSEERQNSLYMHSQPSDGI